MTTYLQPADEHTGAWIGPFYGPIAFGTDPARCHVLLDDEGIRPVHVTLVPRADGSYLVAPEHPEADVYVRTQADGPLWPVDGPATISAEALLFFGTEGPGYRLRQELPPAIPEHDPDALLEAFDRAVGRPRPRSPGGAERAEPAARPRTPVAAQALVAVGSLIGGVLVGAAVCGGGLWLVLDALGSGG